jgi:hypothetical protein
MGWFRYFVSALLVSTLSCFAFWSGTTQDQVICLDAGFDCTNSRIAADSNGDLHVVWLKVTSMFPPGREVLYSKSTDNGRTWSGVSGDIIISFPDDFTAYDHVSLAVGTDDHLYVVWPEQDSFDRIEIQYSISTNGGNSWSGQLGDEVLSYTVGAGSGYNPEIAIDGNNAIHVVWEQAWIGTVKEILYGRSWDGGSSWTSQNADSIISHPDGGESITPDIAVGPNNALYVVWEEPCDSYPSMDVINVSISNDAGVSWTGVSTDQAVTQPFGRIYQPHVVVDPYGAIHVTWIGAVESGSYNYEIYYSKSTDGGVTWSGNSAIQMISDPDVGGMENHELGVDHCGNLISVWHEYWVDSYEVLISISTDGGVTWSGSTQEEIISYQDQQSAYRPAVTAGIDDTLHVVWDERTTVSYYSKVHYSRGDALGQAEVTPIDDLIMSADSLDVTLGWDSVSGAIGYKIYRNEDPAFTPQPADSVGYTTLNWWIDPGIVAEGTAMFYIVTVIY